MKNNFTIVHVVAALLLFLFVYAALKKLGAPERFEDVLGQSFVLKPYNYLLVIAVPAAELSIALLLFFVSTRLAGLYVAALLLLCYTVYLGWMLLFAKQLPCNCGGLTEQLSWEGQFLLNVFLFTVTIAAIVLFYLQRSGRKRAPPV